ncbi:2-oxoglutarate and iron-dependent oxygenase JMJD4-like [Actinia tenebrosa]|uniref:2-oxoglutarate and iron-dependent oxygenase JMJD4-like n=1 Tax=Actinia tenebrosa TaxID=6105 RepID=A0A6P8IU16_ACTTE|nr:2-oxoglutarate and iron-dependent oxygenase JMJD4-like [Actinia tenebrosa]XP_031570534.1 2-oxoglutarate and iron-dependent oxygenase JMJD4-like [Actinia tenebrosa]
MAKKISLKKARKNTRKHSNGVEKRNNGSEEDSTDSRFGYKAVFFSSFAAILGFLLQRGIWQNEMLLPDNNGGWGKAAMKDEQLFNTSQCDIERRFAEDLTKDDFEKNYRFRKPVLLKFKDGAAGWTDPWKWTKDNLVKEYGKWTVLSGTSDNIVRSGGNGDQKSSFTEYLNEIMNNEKLKKEPWYMFDRNFYESSDLPDTIRPPSYLRITDDDSSIFFLGGSGSGVSFHKHADAWNGVVYGRKRWFLYPVEFTPPGGVWPSFSQREWFNKVYPTLRPKQMPQECVQEAGEIMYLPESYYHGTINIGDTVAIGIQKIEATTRIEAMSYQASGQLGDLVREAKSPDDPLFDQVEKKYKKIVSMLPASSEALHKLATLYFHRGNFKDAIKAMEKAVALDPWFVIARVDLAKFYVKLRRPEIAESILKEALKIHPDSADGNWHYASLINAKGEYHKAAKLYRKLISMNPNKSFVYFQLASILENIGDVDGAKEVRQQGQDLDERRRKMKNTK